MRSTKNTRAVIVGIFIVIALAIFVVGVLTLGGQRKSFSDALTLHAVFKDVEGLQAGNNIWYSGVKVGTVKKISFNPDGNVAVDLSVDEKMKAYIHNDAKVKVGSDGLIGNRIIVIYGDSPAAPFVKNGDVLNAGKVAGMDEMMATLQSNNENLLAITNDFKLISGKMADGQGTIGKLLNDETLVNTMEIAMMNLQRAANNATELTRDVAAYTDKLNQPGSLTNDLVTDTVIFSKLRSSVTEIQNLSRTANEVVNNLQSATSGINNSLQDPSTPAGVLLKDKQTAASLKATIRNLETSTKKLDENMEALQSNFLLRGFFRKRAKAEADTAR